MLVIWGLISGGLYSGGGLIFGREFVLVGRGLIFWWGVLIFGILRYVHELTTATMFGYFDPILKECI